MKIRGEGFRGPASLEERAQRFPAGPRVVGGVESYAFLDKTLETRGVEPPRVNEVNPYPSGTGQARGIEQRLGLELIVADDDVPPEADAVEEFVDLDDILDAFFYGVFGHV